VTGTESANALTAIDIPDAAAEPAAYVQALIHALGDRDALKVYETTAEQVRRLCQDLSVPQWNVPLGKGEWNAAQIVGHLIDVDIVYGFRFRLVLTEDVPVYPGYDEKLWSQLPHPDPADLVRALTGLRAYNAALLRRTPRDRWQRWGTHSEQGREQFSLMITKIAGHDLAHLNQLARTVEVAAKVNSGATSSRSEMCMPSTSQPGMTLQRLQQFSAAWTAGDLDALMSYMTDDCVYHASVGPEPGSTYRGKSEVRRGFAAILAYDQGRERHDGTAFINGNAGVAQWSFCDRASDGAERLIRGCDIFEFVGDKICKKDAFRKVFDTI